MSENRRKQVYTTLVKEFVRRWGRVPTQAELYRSIQDSFYKPLAKPLVPKNKARSSAEYFGQTMKGLLGDTKDVLEILKGTEDANLQLRVGVEDGARDVANQARAAIKRIRHQDTIHKSKVALVDVLPEPIKRLSPYTRYGTSVTLLQDSLAPISYIPTVIPTSDKTIDRYELNEFSLPYSAFVRAKEDASYSGFTLELLIQDDGTDIQGPINITRLYYDGSPVMMTIEVSGDDGEWTTVTTVNPIGRTEYIINESTTKLRLTFTQSGNYSKIYIKDLQVYRERYQPEGIYVSGPYDLSKAAGRLKVEPNQYIPSDTSVIWEYGLDYPLSGRYVSTSGDIVHPDSPLFTNNTTYDTSVESGSLHYSDIVPFDALSENFHSPGWKSIPTRGTLFNAELDESNSTSLYNGAGGSYNNSIRHIATLDSKVIDESIKITYGKDCWKFSETDAPVIILNEDGTQTQISTPFHHWMTHLIVRGQTSSVRFNNPAHPRDAAKSAIKEIILQNTSTGEIIIDQLFDDPITIVKGIWKCILVYNLLDSESPPESFPLDPRAAAWTGIDPFQVVTPGDDISFMIQPFPATRVSIENIIDAASLCTNINRFAIEVQDGGQKKILMPQAYTLGLTDILGSEPWFIYSTEDTLAGFYDISYMKEVDEPIDNIFLRARLETEDPNKTPIIRGVTLSVDEHLWDTVQQEEAGITDYTEGEEPEQQPGLG